MSEPFRSPSTTVRLGATELSAGTAPSSIHIGERVGFPTVCELEFVPVRDETVETMTDLGSAVEIAVGGTSLFTGEVTALERTYGAEGRRTIRVRAYDRLHRLRKRQPLRAHVGLSLPALARELTSDIGVSVQGGDGLPTLSRRIQHGDSDLSLLADAARRLGVSFVLRGSVLHLFRGEGVGDTVDLELGKSLREASVEINADSTCRTVEVSAWNPFRGEFQSGTARGRHSGRTATAEAAPDQVGGDQLRVIAGTVVEDEAEAEAIARAELERRTATEVALRGIALDAPLLRAGSPLRVSGLAPSLCGVFVAAYVSHRITSAGHIVEFTTEDAPHRPRGLAGATLGVVLDSADPEGSGRVRVRLPAYGDVESDWLSVLSIAAGKGKGLVAVPEPGDRVLVLPLDEDPARSLVIGGLYCPDAPPDSGFAEDGARRYTLVTPGGQRLCLDDGARTVRLDTENGNRLSMEPDRVHLHAAADLTLEAPGKTIRIRAQAIEFERA